MKLANTHITASQAVEAGAFTPPGAPPNGPAPAAYKALAGLLPRGRVIKPSADSDIQFEVWMPPRDGTASSRASATAASRARSATGDWAPRCATATPTAHRHRPRAGGNDAAWALGHPEKVVDFGHRAIHETAVTAKAIIEAFYGERPAILLHSCSNGGRQALMEAQRYPEDYDGIIAGAPANYWTHLLARRVVTQAAWPSPASYIPAAKLPAIEAAAMAACDARDGVKDGVIERPRRMPLRPAKLCARGPSRTRA